MVSNHLLPKIHSKSSPKQLQNLASMIVGKKCGEAEGYDMTPNKIRKSHHTQLIVSFQYFPLLPFYKQDILATQRTST